MNAGDSLPLFPLGRPLVPGLLLPLHLFEPRYRRLASDLQQVTDAQARFGVVGIRSGLEVGSEVPEIYPVGCVAEVTSLSANDDGTFEIAAVGAQRFEVHDLDPSGPYLRGTVTYLDEDDGPDAEQWAPRVRQLFGEYRQLIGMDPVPEDLTTRTLSYVVTAAMVLEPDRTQQLLAAGDTTARLQLAERVLRDELRVIRSLASLPATDLVRSPIAMN